MIQGHVFFVDFMKLAFYRSNINLGMDWLKEHKAKVDFELTRVTLQNGEGVEIFEVGKQTQFLSNMVSTIRVEKMMLKG